MIDIRFYMFTIVSDAPALFGNFQNFQLMLITRS